MGVYLPNVDMPKEGFVEILIRDDGTVQQTGQSFRIGGTDYYTPYVGEMPAMYKAVPVPPHGDLIERDALAKHVTVEWFCGNKRMNVPWRAVEDAPTIIPTEPLNEEVNE